jgi:hypothetical protein
VAGVRCSAAEIGKWGYGEIRKSMRPTDACARAQSVQRTKGKGEHQERRAAFAEASLRAHGIAWHPSQPFQYVLAVQAFARLTGTLVGWISAEQRLCEALLGVGCERRS